VLYYNCVNEFGHVPLCAKEKEPRRRRKIIDNLLETTLYTLGLTGSRLVGLTNQPVYLLPCMLWVKFH